MTGLEFMNGVTDNNESLIIRAGRVSFAISVLTGSISFIWLIQNPSWEKIGLLLLSLTCLVGSGLAVSLAHKKNTRSSSLTLFFLALFVGFVLPLLYQNVAAFILLVLLSVIAFLTKKYNNQLLFRNLIAFCSLVFFIAIFMDTIGYDYRITFIPPYGEGIIYGFIIVVLIFLFVRQFSISSLRYKVLISFLIITIFVVMIMSLYSILTSRDIVTETGYRSLQNAASLLAGELDIFFRAAQNSPEMSLYKFELAEILSQTEDDDSTGENTLIKEALKNFLVVTRNDRSGFDRSSFIMGYLVFDEKGRVTAYPTSLLENVSVYSVYLRNINNPIDTYISPVLFLSESQPEFLVAEPIVDLDGVRTGIFVYVYDAAVIQRIVVEANGFVDESSSGWIFNENGLLLAQGIYSQDLYKILPGKNKNQIDSLTQAKQLPETIDISFFNGNNDLRTGLDDLQNNQFTQFTYIDNSTTPSFLYRASAVRMESRPWSVVYSQQEDNFFLPIETELFNLKILTILLFLTMILIATGFSRFITQPIISITRVAHQVADGDLHARVLLHANDEYGALARAINQMTEQLQQSLFDMEERVSHRTFELERRSRQLQLAADVGRAAATIHDLNELLSTITNMISERFDHYHVGVFLVDESGEYTVLRAANSEGGKKLLASGYRLAIGHQGIVGKVAATGHAKISDSQDIVNSGIANPELPHTQSELTLPLISSRNLLGVIDVHSMKPGAFSQDDVVVMQVLADLIAVAIDNARLFAEGRESVEATRRAYGEISHAAWIEKLQSRKSLTYRSQARSTYRLGDSHQEELALPQQISVPIKVRGTVIGYVDTYKQLDKGYWTEEEEEALQKLVDQIGIALESARLFEASQVQAERERLVGEINSRFQESLEIDTVLKTAALEIRQALNLHDVTILLEKDIPSLFTGETEENE